MNKYDWFEGLTLSAFTVSVVCGYRCSIFLFSLNKLEMENASFPGGADDFSLGEEEHSPHS